MRTKQLRAKRLQKQKRQQKSNLLSLLATKLERAVFHEAARFAFFRS